MERMTAPTRLGTMAAALLGLGLALVLSIRPVTANGTPIMIVLSYLQGVATWGSTGAAGTAELVLQEGEVRLNATGLPRLSGEYYQLWIVRGGNQRMALASFNAEPDGVARLDLVLPGEIPDAAWELMLVSVESGPNPPSAPSGRIALAGRFPTPGSAEAKPGELPRTGGPSPAEAAPPSGGGAGNSGLGPGQIAGGLAALVAVALGGFWLGRKSARRVR